MSNKRYVVAMTSNHRFLFEAGVEWEGVDIVDAVKAAQQLTKSSGENHFVFELEIRITHTVEAIRSIRTRTVSEFGDDAL